MDDITNLESFRKRSKKADSRPAWQQMSDVIDSDANRTAVQAELDRTFSRTPNPRHRVVLPDFSVAYEQNTRVGGTLYPFSTAKGRFITSTQFPEYLEQTGLDKETAMQLAGSSAIAYAGLFSWFRDFPEHQRNMLFRERQRSYLKITRPEAWSSDAYEVGTDLQLPHVIIHRSAARIALNVCGLFSLEPTASSPRSFHIAALVDPLGNKQLGQLHDILVV